MKDKKIWLGLGLVLCIAAMMMLTWLGNFPLLDPDEPVYAETAREMLQFNDFISPRIYGDYWYDKPPMYYWLVAIVFKLFGVAEFAARFPSAILAICGSLLICVSGWKLFNLRAGILSGLVLATSLEYFYLGKAAVTDICLTLFLTAALLAFFHRFYYLMYACMGIAVLTKGPVGIVLCGAIIGIYLIVTKQCSILRQMHIVRGGLLFAVITLPWYASMYYYHGMDFINTFLGFHNVTRFLQPEHPSGKLWYYYFPVLVLGLFPWTSFLFAAIINSIKDKASDGRICLFLTIWTGVVFVFFTLAQTKLVSYILPLYPPLAMLIGWYFDTIWADKRYVSLIRTAAISSLIRIFLAAGLLYTALNKLPEMLPQMALLAGILLAFTILSILLGYRQKFQAVFAVYVVEMLIVTNIMMLQVLPAIAPLFSVKALVAEFNTNYDGHSPLYIAKFYRPGFAFYSGNYGIEIAPEKVASLIANPHEKLYIIIQKKYYDELKPELQDKIQILYRQEDKILGLRKLD